MALTSKDGLVAAIAAAQDVEIFKSAARTTVASTWFSLYDLAGNPGAGTLAGTSTAAGVVPTSATPGHPLINAFTGANTGYITNIDFGSSVATRFRLYDLLWKGGAYAFNAAQTLAAQPAFSSRIVNTDYTSCSIWLECVTAFTGLQSIAITYTNQSGTAGRTTGVIATGVAPTVGRLFQIPLQAGDSGVQKIESVTSTVSTAGTFNVLVMKRLWSGRCRLNNDGDTHAADKTGLPIVFATSALYLMMATDSTSTGTPELQVSIGNG